MRRPGKNIAQRKPGQSGPAAFAFLGPGPQLGNCTKKILLAQQQKPLCFTAYRGGEDRGFDQRISSEPAPSHRPWMLAAGATLLPTP